MCRLVDIKTNHGEDVRVADVKRDEIINIINAASLCKKIEMLIPKQNIDKLFLK